MPDHKAEADKPACASHADRRQQETRRILTLIAAQMKPLFDLIPPGHTVMLQAETGKIVAPGRPVNQGTLIISRPAVIAHVVAK